ncbi:hypothetical protein [Neobacillus sp. CF12]|uniref:hypothetical protein n=1 Tax=Neobacillus sp. CF12 TaxID=3055864 RepID=UPI0025A0DE6C|nr:hypothetical protein [Neobacillus sp. CF12]MDM5326817.1 hypothetical protein [Neobacillus sp. CF12]
MGIVLFALIIFVIIAHNQLGEAGKIILWKVIGGAVVLFGLVGIIIGIAEGPSRSSYNGGYDEQDFQDMQRNHNVLEMIEKQY